MKAQFRYLFREQLTLRAAALLTVLAMNIGFGLFGYFTAFGAGLRITAVTLCSIALAGMIAVCVIADVKILGGMFMAPAGYLYVLTPVKSRIMLLARIVTALSEDLICIVTAVAGVVLQSFILSGLDEMIGVVYAAWHWEYLWGLLIMLLGYLQVIVVALFCTALSKSICFGKRAGALLAIGATAAVVYVLNLLNFILVPFGAVERWGLLFNINLNLGLNAGMLIYILLSLAKSAALFLAAAYLTERRINL